jgi:hypothetical protein
VEAPAAPLNINPFKRFKQTTSSTSSRNPFQLLSMSARPNISVEEAKPEIGKVPNLPKLNPFSVFSVAIEDEPTTKEDVEEGSVAQPNEPTPIQEEEVIATVIEPESPTDQLPKIVTSVTFTSLKPFSWTVPSSTMEDSSAIESFTSSYDDTTTISWLKSMFYYSWIDLTLHPIILASGTYV